MITPAWCAMMARYNAWQNNQLSIMFDAMDHASLIRNRGAFFDSILGTANHVLWGDAMWMARFRGEPRLEIAIGESTTLHADAPEWVRARARMDQRISQWAMGLDARALNGDLTWVSGISKREATKPLAQCVTHMFNHQTHHRGQIHAMLTASGSPAPITDLAFMPEA